MAVVWQRTVNGKNYEVRSAGQTRRLYTDGVFHSQFNPNKQLTGNVWDLISLPSFFLDKTNIRRVLMLGVGGGAVLSQYSQWYPDAELVGVELDKTHIQIAKQHFGLQSPNIQLIQADAIKWVSQYRGLPFDIVIDDLFGEADGEPARAIEATKSWTSKLAGLLSSHGMLVMNFTESKSLRSSYLLGKDSLPFRFKMAYRFMTPLYENQIGVFLRRPAKTNEWRKRVKADAQLASEYEQYRDKYQLRKLMG